MLEQQVIGQLIDTQLIVNKKLDQILDLLSKLTNTIIKYDDEYQKQIAKEAMQ